MTAPVGTFCLVLHSHLPWLAHHGRWPVGEEWLYQSWCKAVAFGLDANDIGFPRFQPIERECSE